MSEYEQATIRTVAEVLASIAHDTASTGEYDSDACEVIDTLVQAGWTPPR